MFRSYHGGLRTSQMVFQPRSIRPSAQTGFVCRNGFKYRLIIKYDQLLYDVPGSIAGRQVAVWLLPGIR